MSEVLRELAERLERDSIEAMDVGRPHLADRLTDDMETLRLAADVLDAIPGDDKLAVVRYCVEFTRADHHCFDAGSTGNEWLKWNAKRAALWDSCPPSVRAALALT